MCGDSVLSGPNPGPHYMTNSINNTSILLRLSIRSVPGPPCYDYLIQIIVITQEEGVVLTPILKTNKLRRDQRGEKTCSGPLTISEEPGFEPCPSDRRAGAPTHEAACLAVSGLTAGVAQGSRR